MLRTNFYKEIEKNKRKSILLAFTFIILISLFGAIVGLVITPDSFFEIQIIFTIISLVYVWFTYTFSDKIAIKFSGAREAKRNEYLVLNDLVEGLSIAAGIKKPKIYVLDSEDINAFATGKDPDHGIIVVTKGALNKLNKRELEGVLAHEISHILNNDIKFMSFVVALVGMVSLLSQLFLRSRWKVSNKKEDKTIIIILGFILAILAPIFAKLVQLAISRKREYLADATAVKLTRYPYGLANALKKIMYENKGINVSDAIAPLFISSPLRNMSNWLSTHPPIEKRIKILESM